MIDREKVIAGLEHEVVRTESEWLDCVEVALLQDALALLKEQVSRVHGRWIDENPNDYMDVRMRCSACRRIDTPLANWDYCPHCGAKMDGGDEND